MTKPIRVGLMGLGQRGLQHLKAVWQLQEQGLAEVVALVDAFPENLVETKIQQFVPGFKAGNIFHTTNPLEVIEAKDKARQVDAFYVNIPPNVHQGEVVRAAKAGIHLFVEKPMSLFLDEALEMEAAIAAAGVLSTVGFQQRFDVRHEAMQQFLADKRVVMANYLLHAPIESHWVKHTPTDRVGGPANRVWTANRAWSGTTLVEAGIHPLDLWRYWFGNVVWVQATYIPRPPEEILDGADNPYAYTVNFGFAGGAIGSMILSRLRRVYHTQYEHMVLWNEGYLRFEGDEVAAYHYDGPYPPPQQPDGAEVRHSLPLAPPKNTTLEISRAFLEAIAKNSPDLIRSSFSDAMNSLAAVIGANVSDELGGVRVDLTDLLNSSSYARFRRRPEGL
jgi:predicted dehydrogenase